MRLHERPTPLAALISGALAGTAGTAAMDLYWYAKYRKDGGQSGFLKWEFSVPADWEKVSAPGKLGRRIIEGFTQRPLSPEYAPLVNAGMHWGYGMTWGSAYGAVAGSMRHTHTSSGITFGILVWLNGYAVLPLAKLYKPIWEYDAKTLGWDLGGHLTYGVSTAATFGLVRRILGRFASR